MKKIKIMIFMMMLLVLPLSAKAETCTNCITLSDSQTVEAGSSATFTLTANFSSAYANKIKKIEYTVNVEDSKGIVQSKVESSINETLTYWGRNNNGFGVYTYTKGSSSFEVSSGDKIAAYKISINASATVGSAVSVSISDVKYYYEVDDPSSSGATTLLAINGTGTSLRTITVKDKESVSSVAKSNIALLESLAVSQGIITPEFNAETEVYNIAVKDTIAKLTITAICQANCSSINQNTTGTYKSQIVLAKNEVTTVKITIISQDGMNAKNYTVNISRGEVVNDTANLKSLTIEEGTLSPVFDPNVLEYTLSVDDTTKSLNIDYELVNSESTVEVVGGTNLTTGTNIVKINVSSSDNVTTKSYIITVTKGDELSSDEVSSSSTTVPVTDSKISIGKILLIVLIIGISLALIIVAFYFIFKKKKENKKINDVLSKNTDPDVTISHANDKELLELTREFNIVPEIRKNIKNDDENE